MIGGHKKDALFLHPFAPIPGDADLIPQHGPGRSGPQQHDHLGPHQRKLRPQIGHAGSGLLRRGHPILRRAAFHHIADVNFFPGIADGGNHFRQQLPGLAHKGQPLQIFIRAGAFANEHQIGLAIALARHFMMDILA